MWTYNTHKLEWNAYTHSKNRQLVSKYKHLQCPPINIFQQRLWKISMQMPSRAPARRSSRFWTGEHCLLPSRKCTGEPVWAIVELIEAKQTFFEGRRHLGSYGSHVTDRILPQVV